MDGSWTSTSQFNRHGWAWKEKPGYIQLMGTRNMRQRETSLLSELSSLIWTMGNILSHSTCQNFEIASKNLITMITKLQTWPKFSIEFQEIFMLQSRFQSFKQEEEYRSYQLLNYRLLGFNFQKFKFVLSFPVQFVRQ